MNYPILCAFCCLTLASCDKAKHLADRAKEAVVEKVEEVKGGMAGEKPAAPDAALQSLVDHTEEGYLFRKDLPFPAHLKVKTHSGMRFKGRHFQASLLGQGSGSIDGDFKEGSEIEKNGETVSVQLHESVFTSAVPAGEELPEDHKKVIRRAASLKMERKGRNWVPASKEIDFLAASAITGPGMDAELVENGLLPRPFWFGKRRLKIGDEVTLAGDHLLMMGPSKAKGRIRLKLESIEPFDGHPCGVFSISGAVDGSAINRFSEGRQEENYTIESGKVWLSLVHPIVLKEEIDAVVTSKSGEGKSVSSHTQGRAAILIEREWRVLPDGGL